MKTVLLLTAMSAVALLANQADAKPAGASSPLAPYSTMHTPKPPKPVLHVPIGSYTTSGNLNGAALAQGFNDIDAPTSYTCTKADGCTIIIRATVQVRSDVDNNIWAICPIVDGLSPANSCGYIGYLSIAGFYTTATVDTEATVAKGKHLLNTQVYLGGGTGIGANYHITYEFTTP